MTTAAADAEIYAFPVEPVRRPPAFHDGLVSRARLVEQLADPAGPPIALVAAPAGYGKTTLLAEWAQQETRPLAWVALGPDHNDPSLLAAAIARSIDGPAPFALVLDDVHVLHSSGAMQVVRALVDRMRTGSRLVLSTRTEPALPIGRLRAHRALVELRSRDLAMTPAEAAALCEREGLQLAPSDVDALMRRTEGWPAGVYLAAASLRDATDADAAVRQYLADVVLPELPDRTVKFLVHTSILDRLSAPVCDAVLGGHGSARVLDELARNRLLLVPLDRTGTSYRCPAPLAEMVSAELRSRGPAIERQLRARATEWYAAHGDCDRAIDQAIAAGAPARAAELLWATVPSYVASGRAATVRRWLDGFTAEQIAADPRLALAAGDAALADGDLGAVQRWESTARRAVDAVPQGARDTALEAGVAVMRSALARDGLVRMGQDAAHAQRLVAEDSPWRSICCFLEGVALHLTGASDAGERVLEEGVRRGAAVAPSAQALCMAQLALMAAARDDLEGAAAFCARARAQVDHYGLDDYPALALVYAASAQVRARLGRVEEARSDLRRATGMLGRLVDFAPWYEAQACAALAGAALKLSDLPTARELLAAAVRSGRRAPEATVVQEWIADADADAQASAASAASLPGPAALTTAELRILRFLPTHLSFREIAGRLYVSANTVKTQAHAVYRKLDASSRSQAVTRAGELGLLDV